MSNKERVACSAGQHADDSQPDVSCTLRRIAAKSDTQHVRQRLKQRPRVLFQPTRMLYTTRTTYYTSLLSDDEENE